MKTKTAYGFDGSGYSVGDRVELHPGMDLWMRGARFGVVVGITSKRVRVKVDKTGRVVSGSAERFKNSGW